MSIWPFGAKERTYEIQMRRGVEMNWSERRDLNPRPFAPEANALPDCATLRHEHVLIKTLRDAKR